MFDLLSRIIRHPRDYAPMLRTFDTPLKHIKHETGDVYSFFFSIPEGVHWKAGQHTVWHFDTTNAAKKENWRAFSIASSEKEGHLHIATRINDTPSAFKQRLHGLSPGDTMIIRGPFGEFHPHGQPAHIIGIAGGIGITPFRALAYDIAHGHLPKTKLTLVYACPGEYAFAGELDAWSQENDTIDIRYTRSPEETTKTIHTLVGEHHNTADYYISGSPGMVTGITKDLRSQKIKRIVSDPFKGYLA